MEYNSSAQYSEVSAIQANKVLRNTYLLLSMTLFFSAIVAYVAVQMNVGVLSPWLFLGVMLGMSFAINALRNSPFGILMVFAFTGFIGLYVGPIVNAVSASFSNGTEMVTLALGGTGVIFLAMSGIALTTKRDFSGLSKFLFVGILVAFVAMIGNLFLNIPALGLAISAVFMVLSSGIILWQTQQIVRGGETNYITATVTIFVSLYNIFMSLLHILMAFMGED